MVLMTIWAVKWEQASSYRDSEARYSFVWKKLRLTDNLRILSHALRAVKSATGAVSLSLVVDEAIIQGLQILF